MWEFLIAVIAGIVVVRTLIGLKRDESRHRAGKDAKQCPHCLEWIKAEATACRYCQRDVPPRVEVEAESRAYGIWTAIILIVLGVYLCSDGEGTRGRRSDAAVEACVSRGRAYFSELGSFPTLSDGRDALTVARERCLRTTTAF